MAAEKLVFTISKAAAKLIKAGDAILSAGGVRLTDGTMFEMAKPAAQAISQLTSSFGSMNPVVAGVNLASSLASSVQCAFIQAGVNSANVKLDDVLVKLNSISEAMGGLSTVKALSWVNTAFSLANSGISIAGFYWSIVK